MSPIYASIYLHGWDVVDEGAEAVLSRLKDFGFDAVNLAVSYHSGRYILPHNPKRRVYFAEEGVVYFDPHPENYLNTILRPRKSSQYRDVDILDVVVKQAQSHGMKVNAWTVCLHNSFFVYQHPELGVRDPYGSVDYNWMCPNNPDVRNYVMGLIRDLASNYDLDFIQLESAVFPWGIVHMDHHETFEVCVEPLISYLYSTCFCKHCEDKAREQGLNLSEIREKVKNIIETSIHTPSHILSMIPSEDSFRNFYNLTSENPEIQDLMTYKFRVAEEMFEGAKDILSETNPRVRLSVITGAESQGHEGISYRSISKIVDAIDLMVYFDNPQRVYYHVKWAKRGVSDRCKLYAALRVNYPIAFSQSIIREEMAAARDGGADGLNIYNYGRTPLENLRWVKEGLQKIG